MSAQYDALRVRALEVALSEYRRPFTESNDYKAVIDLHLADKEVLENRGERVDQYIINAGASYALDAKGQQGADERMWCGMFVYFCYDKAFKLLGTPGKLPFTGPDLWSGSRLRIWAENYDKRQTQLYNFQTFDARRAGGEMEDIRKQGSSLSSVIVWSNTFSNTHPGAVKVAPGDIFSVNDGHIGLVCDARDGVIFSTLEGNQSGVKEQGTAIATGKMTVSQCSLIIRI